MFNKISLRQAENRRLKQQTIKKKKVGESIQMSKGTIKKVAGPLVIATGMRDANMFDVVRFFPGLMLLLSKQYYSSRIYL